MRAERNSVIDRYGALMAGMFHLFSRYSTVRQRARKWEGLLDFLFAPGLDIDQSETGPFAFRPDRYQVLIFFSTRF